MPKTYVYILECTNGSFYTGYTTDMVRRFTEHKQKSLKSKYTRSFSVKRLAVCWELAENKSIAMKIEALVKKQKRDVKEELVANPHYLIQLVPFTIEYEVLHAEQFIALERVKSAEQERV